MAIHPMTGSDLEGRIAEELRAHHREQQGCVPEKVMAAIVDDLAIVRSIGIFTPNEQRLMSTHEGKKSIQSARRELNTLTRRELEGRIANVLGCPVIRSFFDLDVRTGEQIHVFVLNRTHAVI